MHHPLQNLSKSHREQFVIALLHLRGKLADGTFLREGLYRRDESKLAGNTHHYWVRFGLDPDLLRFFDELLPVTLPEQPARWLRSELERKILRRLPSEYSTLIKLPFSVEIAQVAQRRSERTERAIRHGLPATIPYAIFHLEINRLLSLFGATRHPPTEPELETLLARYSRTAIAKARRRFPELWDEQRGHYVLDSRGSRFAKSLVTELVNRGLLSSDTKFVDVGSGVGTNVLAVNIYSSALATGVEMHPELIRMSQVMRRRLWRLGVIDSERVKFVLGDGFDTDVTTLGQFDVLYVYSPIGRWEIDIDTVVDRARVGAVMIFNRLPVRNRQLVQPLENIAGLYAFRKIAAGEVC